MNILGELKVGSGYKTPSELVLIPFVVSYKIYDILFMTYIYFVIVDVITNIWLHVYISRYKILVNQWLQIIPLYLKFIKIIIQHNL